MDQLKVFVGGLSQHTTKESLNAYFGQFGQADSFVMVDKSTGRSRGFGFVNFGDEQVMATVLQMQHEIDGVPVTISPYSQDKGSASKGAGGGGLGLSQGGCGTLALQSTSAGLGGLGRPAAQRDQLKIFVGGLSQQTTKESLNAYFQQFGYADSFVMIDRATGRSRGFGFVNFQDESLMNAVLQMQHEIDGVPVTCSAYADKNKGLGGGGGGGGGVSAGAGNGGNALASANSALAQLLSQPGVSSLLQKVQAQASQLLGGAASAALGGGGGGGGGGMLGRGNSTCKIFVGGLAQHTTKESLNTYFSQFGQADSIVMMDKASGRSRGFGFVDFADESAMNTVLQYSHQIDGVVVTCSAYASKGGAGGGALGGSQYAAATTVQSTDQFAQQMPAVAATPQEPEFSLATELLEQADAGGDGLNVPAKLFVAGLPQSTTSEMLQEVFGQFGPCECEIMMDRRTGRSRGFGFVQYGSEGAAQNAMAAQHVVDGRTVEVSECWSKGASKGASKIRSTPY